MAVCLPHRYRWPRNLGERLQVPRFVRHTPKPVGARLPAINDDAVGLMNRYQFNNSFIAMICSAT